MLLLLLSSLSLYSSESIWKLTKSLVPFWDFAYNIQGDFWWFQCITLPVIVFLIAWLASYVHCLFSYFRRLEFFCLFLRPLPMFSSFKKTKKTFAVLDLQCAGDHLNMGKFLPGRAEVSDCWCSPVCLLSLVNPGSFQDCVLYLC